MQMKTLYMETTKIQTAQTVADIQKVLGLYGASAIRIDYEDGEVSAVSFLIRTSSGEIPFKLPCRWQSIFDHLQKKRKMHRSQKEDEDRAQAKRVAWRQVLRWIEAQFALVDTGMVQTVEVFMSYIQGNNGKTLFEHYQDNGFKMLEHKGNA
jgi:hypothetical protein